MSEETVEVREETTLSQMSLDNCFLYPMILDIHPIKF